jgi:predicted DsbA family dithiol-disulfide isomerase
MLTLFHDYTSPASAIAVVRLQRLADEGLAVEFAGFEVWVVDIPLPVSLDILAALEELAPTAAAEGLTLMRPPSVPPTARAHLVGELADGVGLGASWRQTVYGAFWSDGMDIGDPDVLIELGVHAGLDRDAVQEHLGDAAALARVRRRMAAHRRNGVGGVPTVLSQRTLVPGLLPVDDLRALSTL